MWVHPVILPDDGVKDRLPRARVAHRRRKRRQHDPVARVADLEQDLVAAHPQRCGHIVFTRLPHEGMQKQAVADLQRASL